MNGPPVKMLLRNFETADCHIQILPWTLFLEERTARAAARLISLAYRKKEGYKLKLWTAIFLEEK